MGIWIRVQPDGWSFQYLSNSPIPRCGMCRVELDRRSWRRTALARAKCRCGNRIATPTGIVIARQHCASPSYRYNSSYPHSVYITWLRSTAVEPWRIIPIPTCAYLKRCIHLRLSHQRKGREDGTMCFWSYTQPSPHWQDYTVQRFPRMTHTPIHRRIRKFSMMR